ncbi:MAG: ADP-ribosylation/Crystallin J1 [Benjaminiella poitrasii]|nr:MAG: ADP-ribosylation/Crystallin J1 [Benjaminiella poitrasii]
MRIPSGCSKLETTTIVDKVKGLIFGAILGDSLGLATEGLSRSEIKDIYGNGPIRFGMDENGVPFHRDQYRSNFEENDFGDDAEQVLLVMESLLENGGHFLSKDFASRLFNYSQHGLRKLNKSPVGMNATNQAVLANPTYKISPQQAAVEVWKTKNNLRGANGALVRAPLIGVLKFWDGTTVIENTAECCRVTHPDPRCMISCVIASTLIARLLRGQDLELDINQSPTASNKSLGLDTYFIDSLSVNDRLQALVRNVVETNKPMLISPHSDPLFVTPETNLDQMQKYYYQLVDYCVPRSLSELALDDSEDCRDTFKCLSAALYCLTREVPPESETEYFKKILMDLVMQGGEADTNAATAGAMLGARFGYSQLPTEWVVGLKRWEWLEDRVDEFCALL